MIQTITILIILIIILKVYWNTTGRQINIGSYLIIFYIFSLLCSFIINVEDKIYTFEASFYFLAILLLFLFPILKFNSNDIHSIASVNIRIFNYISYVFIFIALVSYLYSLFDLIQLSSGYWSIAGFRGDIAGSVVVRDNSIIYYIVALYCQFFPVVLVFFFYSVAFTSNGKIFNSLLLFSSTAYVVHVLVDAGRSGLVLWPMSYGLTYILFRKMLNNTQRYYLKKVLYCMICLFLLILIPITISRFSLDGDKFSWVTSLFSYFGQQFGNFNHLYDAVIFKSNNFIKLFPILNPFEYRPSVLEAYYATLILDALDLNVFSTFIGSFTKILDNKLFLFISAFYNLILYRLLFRTKVVSLGEIIIVVLISQIPLHGLFYYDLNFVISNIYMILTILLSLLFSKHFQSYIN